MTQEEKQLLLKDICARLPYGTKVELHGEVCTVLGYFDDFVMLTSNTPLGQQTNIANIKLYLRPMSSMTEEEKQELKNIAYEYLDKWENTKAPVDKWMQDAKSSSNRANFYNSHHFDYRGLIEKGLAIKVTEENKPYKN